MEFLNAFKSQVFVNKLTYLLKSQDLTLKTLSFSTPKKNSFLVMNGSFKEEIVALKESLTEAFYRNTFVVCIENHYSLSIRNFLLLQVLRMVVLNLLAMSVCKVVKFMLIACKTSNLLFY